MLSLDQKLKLPKTYEKLKGMVGRNGYDLGILGANKGSINIRKRAIYVDHGPMSI